MTISGVEIESLLAIDVGAVTTRATFFDIVDGKYRFIAQGEAPSTYGPPIDDVSEGVRQAVDGLTRITGRTFIDREERIVTSTNSEGAGADGVVATVSAGAPLKIVSVGLLEDISLESASNLAGSIYSRVVETLSMNDRRPIATKIDAILLERPDLVIVAGGTENGASKSVIKLLDPVGLACYLMPETRRPHILFAGNPEVGEDVRKMLAEYGTVHTAPNIRPALDTEQLGPAEVTIRKIYRNVITERNMGLRELNGWASDRLLPSATGFGRMIRFLSQVYDPEKGVLGIDLGASSTIVSAAFAGDLRQKIYSRLGVGAPVGRVLNFSSVPEISRWMVAPISDNTVREYILHKSMYPHSLPMTDEEMELESALARVILRRAIQDAARFFPASAARSQPGLLPWFEPIVASGSVVTNAPTRGATMLLLLDALEPTGITTVVLDQNNIFSSLGAAAELNHILPVQVLETGALLNLGTVIVPVGTARRGEEVLRIRVKYASGEEKQFDIQHGSLIRIPLPVGEPANLHLQPLQRFNVGMGGAGRGGKLRVVGGALGIVVDARGRPLSIPTDPTHRMRDLSKWRKALGL